ncbi:hypothetical protein ACW2Q0_09200 [Nocardia sp. R16R-3T]
MARAHRYAAARGKEERRKESWRGVEVEPVDPGIGRSRDGSTTTPRRATEQGREPLSLVVTARLAA